MSDDQRPKAAEHEEPQDEVEAHKHRLNANDEPAQEGDDEVEAHKHRLNANDEPGQEGDDEVEAHRHVRTAAPDNRSA